MVRVCPTAVKVELRKGFKQKTDQIIDRLLTTETDAADPVEPLEMRGRKRWKTGWKPRVWPLSWPWGGEGRILILSEDLAVGQHQGSSGQSQAPLWPTSPGLLTRGDWESKGNAPSTPALVILASMWQSRPYAMTGLRWHGPNDPIPSLVARTSWSTGKNSSGYGVSVSTGMLGLAKEHKIDNKETLRCLCFFVQFKFIRRLN